MEAFMRQEAPEDEAAWEDEAACLEAVRQNWLAMFRMPEELKTEAVCAEAVGRHPWALNFVPDGMKTPELCAKAVEAAGEALYFVPEELRTEELCAAALLSANFPVLPLIPQDRLEGACRIAAGRGWTPPHDLRRSLKTADAEEALKAERQSAMTADGA